MKIIRYSIEGFKPQVQTHHMDDINYYLYNWNINDFPIHLRSICEEQRQMRIPFIQQHYDDFKCGAWAFIDGHKNNVELNHLKNKVPCWEADIADDTLVFDVNWDKQMKITDEFCTVYGFYLPVSQMNTLCNIRKR